MIVSDRMWPLTVPKMQEFPQVRSIYTYCYNVQEHVEWSRSYSEMCYTFLDKTVLWFVILL